MGSEHQYVSQALSKLATQTHTHTLKHYSDSHRGRLKNQNMHAPSLTRFPQENCSATHLHVRPLASFTTAELMEKIQSRSHMTKKTLA